MYIVKECRRIAGEKSDNPTKRCEKCPFIRMYDYGRRVYYCDNECRGDDMGKVGEGELPEKRPVWCPLI